MDKVIRLNKIKEGPVKIKIHAGYLRNKAKAAGMSTMEYARKHKDSPGRLGKACRLAITMSKWNK